MGLFPEQAVNRDREIKKNPGQRWASPGAQSLRLYRNRKGEISATEIALPVEREQMVLLCGVTGRCQNDTISCSL